jgi:hypothetical protein
LPGWPKGLNLAQMTMIAIEESQPWLYGNEVKSRLIIHGGASALSQRLNGRG